MKMQEAHIVPLARQAVALLQLADQLLALPVNDVQIVVRQLAPLFFHGALHLFPLTGQLIRVHKISPHLLVCTWDATADTAL